MFLGNPGREIDNQQIRRIVWMTLLFALPIAWEKILNTVALCWRRFVLDKYTGAGGDLS